MLLKELFELSKSKRLLCEAEKITKHGIIHFMLNDKERGKSSQTGLVAADGPSQANNLAKKNGFNAQSGANDYTNAWTYHDDNEKKPYGEALEKAKQLKSDGYDVAIVDNSYEYGDDKMLFMFMVVVHDSDLNKLKSSGLLKGRSKAEISDDEAWDFIADNDGLKTAPNGSVFFTPHPALQMNGDWVNSAKSAAFVKDVMKNPKDYYVIAPYTGSSGTDHWDDRVLVKRAGLKVVYDDLNNQMVDNDDDAKTVVRDVNDALVKANIQYKWTLGKYKKFEVSPFSAVQRVPNGFLIFSVEND